MSSTIEISDIANVPMEKDSEEFKYLRAKKLEISMNELNSKVNEMLKTVSKDLHFAWNNKHSFNREGKLIAKIAEFFDIDKLLIKQLFEETIN